MSPSPRVEIRYCFQCKWEARAAWMAQEVLSTFSDSVGEVALVPDTGGTFEIRVDDHLVWSRTERDRFPQPKELKQGVRNVVDPDADLGHADRE
ncbi:MAG: SelT/SelW/SelH family protein [Salinibacter sp.]